MIEDFHLETHPRATHEGTSRLDEFDRLEKSSEIPLLKAKISALATGLWHMKKDIPVHKCRLVSDNKCGCACLHAGVFSKILVYIYICTEYDK